MRDGVRRLLALLDTEPFHAIVDQAHCSFFADGLDRLATDDGIDAWMLETANDVQHISCTCPMGPASDPQAVVAPDGCVHGLDGIRVADAAIMPSVVRTNTNVTSILVGERIAGFINEQEA